MARSKLFRTRLMPMFFGLTFLTGMFLLYQNAAPASKAQNSKAKAGAKMKTLVKSSGKHLGFPKVILDSNSQIHLFYTESSDHWGYNNDKRVIKMESSDFGQSFSKPESIIEKKNVGLSVEGVGLT